jgi:hypothetical protein
MSANNEEECRDAEDMLVRALTILDRNQELLAAAYVSMAIDALASRADRFAELEP